MRCAAAAAIRSLLFTDDQRYADFPAFQCWGVCQLAAGALCLVPKKDCFGLTQQPATKH